MSIAVALVVVGVIAPVVANDVPLIASVDGSWCFPALQEFFGGHSTLPPEGGWKTWWALLPEDSDDWALMPPWPYGPDEPHPDSIRAGPSTAHPLGNDYIGCDVLARIVHGTRTAVLVGLLSTTLALALGILVGGVAGYRGGWVDVCAQRLIELFLCFPAVFLVLAIAAFWGQSLWLLVTVLALVQWPGFARLLRGEFLSLREREFVLAARGLGVSGPRIVLRHMLPAASGPLKVNAAFCVAQAIVVEATLSFLGLGVGSGASSWGGLLAQGREYAHLGAWQLWLFPTLMIVVTVLTCHGLADRKAREGQEEASG